MKSLLSGVAMRLKLEDWLPGQEPALLLMQEGSHMTGFWSFSAPPPASESVQ
jgi:hypothetical protein